MAEHIISAASDLSVPELLEKIRDLSSKHIVQAFNPDIICCREHILWSYLNAKTLFSNHENRAKTISMELLLCVSMSRQINDAIKLVGAKSNKRFILFCDDDSTFKKISKYLKNVSDFKISEKETKARIRRLGIVSGQIDDLAQEIAFHATER